MTLNYDDPYVKRSPGRFWSELHDRFTAPLYNIVAALIAFLFLGQARTTRQGRGVSIISAILVFGLIRTAGIWVLTIFVTRPSAVALVYGIPIIATLVMLALILDRMPAALIRLLQGRRPTVAAAS